jgi:hypothetical protein
MLGGNAAAEKPSGFMMRPAGGMTTMGGGNAVFSSSGVAALEQLKKTAGVSCFQEDAVITGRKKRARLVRSSVGCGTHTLMQLAPSMPADRMVEEQESSRYTLEVYVSLLAQLDAPIKLCVAVRWTFISCHVHMAFLLQHSCLLQLHTNYVHQSSLDSTAVDILPQVQTC